MKRSPMFFGAVAFMGVTLTACQAPLSTTQEVGGLGAVGSATSILDRVALPPGAEPSSHLPTELSDGAGTPAIPALVDVHRTFVLSRPVNLARLVRTHAPRGATAAGNQRGDLGPNHLYEASFCSFRCRPRTATSPMCSSTTRWALRRAARESCASTFMLNGRPSTP